MGALNAAVRAGQPLPAHRPWPRAVVSRDGWEQATQRLHAGNGPCWACGASPASRTWRCWSARRRVRRSQLRVRGGRFPSVGRLHPPAIRLERAMRDLVGLEPEGLPDTRTWLDHGRWATPSARAPAMPADPDRLSLPAGRRREPAPDPGRPGPRRHHRAGALPLHRERRDRRAPRGAARLRSQGHRLAHGGRIRRARGGACRARLGRQHGRLRAGLRPRGRGGARRGGAAASGLAARARGRARAAREPLRRHRRDLQRRGVRHDARAVRPAARAGAARRGRLLRPSADDGPRRSRGHAARPAGRRRATAARAHRGSAGGFPSSSSCTTTRRRSRTEPSGRGSWRRRSRSNSPPAATSGARRDAASTRVARPATRRTTACSSRSRCSRRAT